MKFFRRECPLVAESRRALTVNMQAAAYLGEMRYTRTRTAVDDAANRIDKEVLRNDEISR
jgi:hypothetical protein